MTVLRIQARLSHDENGYDTADVISKLQRNFPNAYIKLMDFKVIDEPTLDAIGYFDVIK